ncbi:hypothetical protein LTS18_007780 [Coniosporium uncinatum]|uniref:Uncharacterized protein n=1 Tax=Coniosporium uncinatum TaxID=93489 RepID=A0ACC3DNS1_9PEZI|nr:hypothetical protein LTS18_007780 [Coniosporium uncinatum]
MLSPQSAIVLAEHPANTFETLFECLTCLELHFDDGIDLDNKMRNLSGLFKTVFSAAKNMQAVHVGFPSHRPLSLPLESLFHNVRWEKLLAVGIQAWKLDAEEIINLARRHREKLKGLRLRDVLLKDGSMWKDVLGFLRQEMLRLDWVSLRRIGYATHFDAQWAAAGAEVPDDPPGGASDSSEEDDDFDEHMDDDDDGNEGHDDTDTLTTHPGPAEDEDDHVIEENDDDDDDDETMNSDDLSNDSDDDDGGDGDDEDNEHGPAGHAMDFPNHTMAPDTPNGTWCNCNGRSAYPDSKEDLGDDGVFVSNAQRKMWEKWVVGRCAEHSSSSGGGGGGGGGGSSGAR